MHGFEYERGQGERDHMHDELSLHFWLVAVDLDGELSSQELCFGIFSFGRPVACFATCHLNHNGRRRAKRPRTLALASLLSSLSSLQDSRDFSSPRKDLVLGRDEGIGT